MADDLNISRQISAALLGSVRVKNLDQLHFEDIDMLGSRAYDQTKTENLVRRFDLEGCRRSDPLTWIPSVMSRAHFENFRIRSHDQTTLLLPGDFRLTCLQGLHRIAAALQWLPPNDLWWNFNIYDSQKLNEDCFRRLREYGESRSHTFSDGEIFRNVRYYQKKGNTKAANEWLARWSPTKCREFNRIYESRGNQRKFERLSFRLDNLLEYPPLWSSWHMGTHLPSLNCPEELADALEEVHLAWKILTCGKPHFLDQDTVEMLEGRCGKLSLSDRRYINEIFHDGRAFPLVPDQHLRNQLLDAALSYTTIIPSLRVFLENVKYLKAMTDAVKRILPKNMKTTIRNTFRRFHVAPAREQFPIQVSEERVIPGAPVDRLTDSFLSAYFQVFLFAMRHFCSLTDTRPLGFKETFANRCPDRLEVYQRFSKVVEDLGFEFPGIPQNRPANSGSIELKAIQSLLTRLRPPELFDYQGSQGSRVLESASTLASILSLLTPRNIQRIIPPQCWSMTEEWSLERRCGMTDAQTFFSDRDYLFLSNIYSPDQPAQENLTSFAVKQSIFRLFFGTRDAIDEVMGEDDQPRAEIWALGQPVQQPPISQALTQQPPPVQQPPISQALTQEPPPVRESPEQNLGTLIPVSLQEQALIRQPTPLQIEPDTIMEDLPPTQVEITSNHADFCKCKINMRAADFCNSLPTSSYPALMFFDMEKGEAMFFTLNQNLSCDDQKQRLAGQVPNTDDRWLANIRPDKINNCVHLEHTSMPAIFERLQEETISKEGIFICYGPTCTYKTPLSTSVSDLEVEFPIFNIQTQLWELARRDIIECLSLYDASTAAEEEI
ncbi:hypothetical protein N7540_012517 [Penicillium herquei]|nr:hypothetical protein N7540_012517 [Penicillium herquei]